MASEFLRKYEADFKSTVEHFKKELLGIRAGRANAAMVENVIVDAYGVKTPIKQLASISTPEPRVLNIQPWDKNLLKDIEKAISYANLGLSATAEATLVRAIVPQMTEENRKDLIKIMSEKLEAAKVAARSVREKAKEDIMSAQKAGDITEDDRYEYVEELDKKITEINKELQTIAEAKEKEIMTV
ncbi:ribosome recycling factor [Patescibacteria group bacterium]|nr:ribosome recycling factor [Patescibacteria group bacterium]